MEIPVPGSILANPEVAVEIMGVMEEIIEAREPVFEPDTPEMAIQMSHYAISIAAMVTASMSAGADNPRQFVKQAARSFQDNVREWKARDVEIQRALRDRGD